ncbi:YbhB/YbcL family Raf kinase inhibitor-like protein [Agromyces sp. CFH 90414]|uniref:YbhB/YbcL family Raf kinase inhibitor-like protein n=1 Tax=Agromyces agglutinans TaxID=2662258 RepID=A0A6I2FCX6_9MICO|nr:YbhB/YbcL family Raf kinase inhibitor-like protein [Agromyces agglutinans]MRG59793.1 YbhB/YbcL family Raf kinase inhibitor-like protein [Agromyces agglutinans]
MLDVDPYGALQRARPVESFRVTSTDVAEGEPLARAQWSTAAGGVDRSPQLSWSGFPERTRGFAVTCFDPDAPSGSGWWHWAVANLPVSVTSLEAGAGSPNGQELPADAVVLRNEEGGRGFIGAAPPRGTGVHRYQFVVHALDVPSLDLDPDTSPAGLGARCYFHALARGILTATASRD